MKEESENMKYKLHSESAIHSNGKGYITFNGHTMHENDIVRDLNAIAIYRDKIKKLEAEIVEPREEVDVEALAVEFVRDCAKNWDCDEDSHRYGTPCRMCEAEKIMEELNKKK
jgi:hypothetical protein